MTPTREYARQCAPAWCRCCTCSRSAWHPTWTKSLSTCWSPPRYGLASATMLCPCFWWELNENLMKSMFNITWIKPGVLQTCCVCVVKQSSQCACSVLGFKHNSQRPYSVFFVNQNSQCICVPSQLDGLLWQFVFKAMAYTWQRALILSCSPRACC